jgi:hypothetical protein
MNRSVFYTLLYVCFFASVADGQNYLSDKNTIETNSANFLKQSSVKILFPKDFCSPVIQTLDDLNPSNLPEGSDYPKIIDSNCDFYQISYTDNVLKRPLTSSYKLERVWNIQNTCEQLNQPNFIHIQHFNTTVQAEYPSSVQVQVSMKLIKNHRIGYELMANRPNPFFENTIIPFRLPRQEPITISIRDLYGNIVFQISGEFEAGYNEISIEPNTFLYSGLYFYTLKTESFFATRIMNAIKD